MTENPLTRPLMGHRHRSKKIRTWLAALIASSLLPGAARAAGETIEFRFNPPNGTTFVEADRLEKTTSRGTEQPEKQVTEGETEYVIRRSRGGYSVSTRPLRPPNLRVAGDIAAMVNTILSNVNLTYDLDQNGRLRRVRGAGRAIEEVERATGFGKREFDLFLQAAGAGNASLEDLLAFHFQKRELFSLMSGARVELGREVTGKGSVPGPLGLIVDATIRRLVTSPIACGNRRCARVEFTVDAQDERIGRKLVDTLRNAFVQMARTLAPPDAGVEDRIPAMAATGSAMRTSTVRLIDPDTGLPYSEKSTMTVTATMEVAGEAAPFVLTEKRDYRYTYR